MRNYNPLLLIDFYKSTHHEQYPVGLTKMVSYYTPRMSRLDDVDTVTFFGLQAFIKEYLIDGFNAGFFSRPEEKRNAPNAGEGNESVYYAADESVLPTAEPGDYIELKKTDAAPVERAHDGENKRDSIYYHK